MYLQVDRLLPLRRGDDFEIFIRSSDEHFSWQYGYWRAYAERAIYRKLCNVQIHIL